MEPGAAWGPGLKRYVFNLALNEFTKSASLMSSGSEFHKSQFILWGRVIDFFFIVCFSFFSPPSCQPPSTWIELFDLRAAVQKEEEPPLPSFTPPPPAIPSAHPCSCIPQEQREQQGGGTLWPGSQEGPSWAGATTGASLAMPTSSLHAPTLSQLGACL